MVKSYQGVRKVIPKKEKDPPILVRDYMARQLITFNPEQPMHDVVNSLIKNKISGGPVVNENGQLVGVISEGDCLKEVVKGKYDNVPNLTGRVKEHMAVDVVSIEPDLNIFEAAKMFLNRRLRRFPVVEGGKLIGQISQKDIMKAVLKIKSHTW